MTPVAVEITAPGSEGRLTLNCTRDEYEFLLRFALLWNDANRAHSAPFIEASTKERLDDESNSPPLHP